MLFMSVSVFCKEYFPGEYCLRLFFIKHEIISASQKVVWFETSSKSHSRRYEYENGPGRTISKMAKQANVYISVAGILTKTKLNLSSLWFHSSDHSDLISDQFKNITAKAT